MLFQIWSPPLTPSFVGSTPAIPATDTIYCIRLSKSNTIYGFCFIWLVFLFPQIGERNGAKARTVKTVDTYCFSRAFMSERISARERWPSKALPLRLARPFRIEFCFSSCFSACFARDSGLFALFCFFKKIGLDIFEDTKRNYRTASLKKEILSRKNERFNISFDYKESLRKVGKFCFYHIHLLAINSRNMLYFSVES